MKILSLITFLLAAVVSAVSQTQTPPERVAPALEAAAMKLLDEYMAAWNSKDVAAWERTFHFPHYRLASGKMTVLERPGQQDEARLWQTMAAGGWHHSKWDRRHIVHASADKIHVDTKFTRYRADGSIIGSYESLYILTKEDGRRGVKLRSSFAQ